MSYLRRWRSKSLIKLKEAAEADIVRLQKDIPLNDAQRLVLDRLLEDRKATLARVNTILTERQIPAGWQGKA